MKISTISLGVIIGLVLLVLINSFTTVPAGHTKVATLFGNVVNIPLREGFHIVNPLLDFTKFDVRSQTFTWKEIEVPSQDKLKTKMDISITFNLIASETPNMKATVGNGASVLATYITPKVRSVLREAGKTVLQSQDFFLDTVQLELQDYVETKLRAYLVPKGVYITAVLFKDITLPEVVTKAVILTKERQELLERERASLLIVEQQAQQEVKRAEARAEAALSDADAIKTLADAEAYKIIAVAIAQARANTKLSKSITGQLVEYKRIEVWNGVYPTTMLTGGGSPSILLGLNTN